MIIIKITVNIYVGAQSEKPMEIGSKLSKAHFLLFVATRIFTLMCYSFK